MPILSRSTFYFPLLLSIIEFHPPLIIATSQSLIGSAPSASLVESSNELNSNDPTRNDKDDSPVLQLVQAEVAGHDFTSSLGSQGNLQSYLSSHPELVVDKRAFKLGKRSDELSSDDVMTLSGNKKAFKFGKKSEFSETNADNVDKRAFKFGKKSNDQWPEADTDVKRGEFKFGKRNDFDHFNDLYEDLEEKRAFKFGKRPADRGPMFKFGKRSVDEMLTPVEWPAHVDRNAFMFSRLPSLYESPDYAQQSPGFVTDLVDQSMGDKRAFKFGKRKSLEEQFDEKRAFKFGKRLYGDLKSPSYINNEPRFDGEGLWGQGRSQLGDNTGDKRAFKFGKRPYDNSWIQQLNEQQQQRYQVPNLLLQPQQSSAAAADSRRFMFKLGKRAESHLGSNDLAAEQLLKREFKFGK